MKDKSKDWHMYLFAWIIYASVIVLVAMLFYHEIPNSNRDIINIALGVILGMGKDVVGYFFGSSKSSADKTEAIKNMQPIPENSITVSTTDDKTLTDKKDAE